MLKLLNMTAKGLTGTFCMLNKIYILIIVSLCNFFLCSCRECKSDLLSDNKNLQYALNLSGSNSVELKKVLDHYCSDPEKLKAALFLIENMPGHYSYKDNVTDDYYAIALNLFASDLDPVTQRDSLKALSLGRFAGLEQNTVPDVRVITSEYLIRNIDAAFSVWQTERWAKHLTFEEFCEYLLPYKIIELQSLDAWRDTMSERFSSDLREMLYDDESYDSPFRAVNVVRQEILRKVKPVGMYNKSGYPMRSSSTLSRMTFGTCADYVNLGVLTYRSLGIPVVIDYTPSWGRYRAGHSWYTLLNEHGEFMPSEWDISSVPGGPFFPYQRIPKVYRNTYSINRDRVPYHNKSVLKHPFSLFEIDVTDSYFRTSDVNLAIRKGVNLVENFAYIATFCGYSNEWTLIDYCEIQKGFVHFKSMGRNILYCVFGYDGKELVALSSPFILHKDGKIEMIDYNPEIRESIEIHRKYYSSENVVSMRHRLQGGLIQASNSLDFSNKVDVLLIDSLLFPDLQIIKTQDKYRYWRYLSPDGSFGSISELAFFNSDSVRISGTPIANRGVDVSVISKAFDEDWLTNFETDSPNDNWVGMDFGFPISVDYVRVVPRGDDNDIHPGDEYELKYWDGFYWVTAEIQTAEGNSLKFSDAPTGALMWLHDRTRGRDERLFLLRNGRPEWW